MVTVTECKIAIPTYREPAAEQMPMFAQNRIHQRTSGNPYPNHIVSEVDRKHKENKDYTCIRLENEYLKIEILSELGGRIYSAYDKTTGYDFFYKQHVIKPALIGCLGSWISGGVEFNWPFHHRASTFMPTDYFIDRKKDGSVTTYPIASNALGVFNGIRYNGDTDISMHKNTIQPTSYFCAPSKYDFFGGYDRFKRCGVVHVANHHISVGKKMFTWAYNQLSESWENALTDSDGAYAELMAGSYSDNQPDFAWIEPY